VVVRASAPVRIDLAGAWTDCAPFAEAFGGATLTAAIALRITGVFEHREDHEALLAPEGGATLQYSSPAPVGAGLGTSAAMSLVWLALVRQQPVHGLAERAALAELAYETERTLGILGGKQDQYSAACGGLRLYRFGRDEVEVVDVSVGPATRADLLERLVLLYTGRSRYSSRIHADVWERFAAGDCGVVAALLELRDSAEEARLSIEEGDLAALGRTLSRQTGLMLGLSEATHTPGLDDLATGLEGRLLGAKPMGAGGGGCVLLLVRGPADRGPVLQATAERGWQEIPLAWDDEGLSVTIDD
jgi:D-glycero-alpha-D-manno-heptose-7-phosphate kinase